MVLGSPDGDEAMTWYSELTVTWWTVRLDQLTGAKRREFEGMIHVITSNNQTWNDP